MTSADVLAAILAARNNPANAAFFKTSASNYLGSPSLGLTTGQLQQVESTGTVNVLAGGVLYNVQPSTGSQPFTYTPVSTSPQTAPVVTNTPTPTATTVPSNTGSTSTGRNISSTLSQGLSQIQNYIGPVGIAIAIGLGLILVLKK